MGHIPLGHEWDIWDMGHIATCYTPPKGHTVSTLNAILATLTHDPFLSRAVLSLSLITTGAFLIVIGILIGMRL